MCINLVVNPICTFLELIVKDLDKVNGEVSPRAVPVTLGKEFKSVTGDTFIPVTPLFNNAVFVGDWLIKYSLPAGLEANAGFKVIPVAVN